MNRLASSTSPYLLQHAGNPVEWWPWGGQAFAEAVRRDVPILLSVGYAACHWCHVMAHESFENSALAAQLNASFVAVKVDREERPDIDAVYMAATQAITGQGGWPMTVFLTPDGRPFYAGTYYPPEPRRGLPGFGQLLTAVADAWRDQRSALLESATTISTSLAAANSSLPTGAARVQTWPTLLDEAADRLVDTLDQDRGGFGRAPKFPPAMACEFLLRQHRRTGSEKALAAVNLTLDAMARGGIYDQLAGGFARYSVDADWVVPHFEKMLYDNALLLRVYTHHFRVSGLAQSARVVAETVEFLLDELLTDAGAFASSLDADTNGVEGLTYVWTPAELAAVLGPDDGAWVARLCTVTADGTFEEGSSVLQRRTDPSDDRRWSTARAALAAARADRPQPARDDKVIMSWNGLAIAALAEAGTGFDRPDWVAAAARAADHLIEAHRVDGRWWRSSRDGALATAPAVLSDHADFADGLLALHQATSNPRYLDTAGELLELALAHFGDGAGSFFDTADDAETLLIRPRDITDGATPAGPSALVGALLTDAALTGESRFRAVTDAELVRMLPLLSRHPRSAGRWLATAEAAVSGPVQVAVVGDRTAGADLLAAARRFAPAGSVFAVGDGSDDLSLELLAFRTPIDGRAAAYVCRGFVCERPVTTVSELVALLEGRRRPV